MSNTFPLRVVLNSGGKCTEHGDLKHKSTATVVIIYLRKICDPENYSSKSK